MVARHPNDAASVIDLVSTTLFGAFAKARHGQNLDQFFAAARRVGLTLWRALPA
jgi:hypothetical protein